MTRSRKGIGGRPTLLTPERRERLIRAMTEGSYHVTGAALGIGRGTLYRWVQQGRANPNGWYGPLFTAMIQTRIEADAMIERLPAIAPQPIGVGAWLLPKPEPCVYTIYAGDEPIYIGMTGNILYRVGYHWQRAAWMKEATRVEFVTFGTMAEARSYERVAIERHQPRHNVMGVVTDYTGRRVRDATR